MQWGLIFFLVILIDQIKLVSLKVNKKHSTAIALDILGVITFYAVYTTIENHMMQTEHQNLTTVSQVSVLLTLEYYSGINNSK